MRRLPILLGVALATPAAADRPVDGAPTSVSGVAPDGGELTAEEQAAVDAATAGEETIVLDDSVAPFDTPSAGVRVVNARALELTPHKNADDLLRLVPGLYLSQHGSEGKGQQFFLRGFDAIHGADLALRVGGVLVNEPSNVHGQGYADLGFVVPEVVVGLTSRKGPFDLEQGWFAMAGSIELELGAVERGRRVGYQLGSTHRHRLVAVDAPAGGPVPEVVAVEAMHDDGYGEGRGSQRMTVLGQTELTVGRLRVRPMVVGYAARFGEPGVTPLEDIERGTFARDAAPAGDLTGASNRLLAGLDARWSAGGDEVRVSSHLGWRRLRLDENFTGFLVSPEHGDARRQSHRAVVGGVRAVWRHRLGWGLRLLAGGEVAHDELVQAEDRIDGRGVAWRAERALDASVTGLGGWLGGELRRGRWTVAGGARADALVVDARDLLAPERSGSGAVAAVSPRLAVAWRSPGGTVAAAIGRGVRPPEARAFTRRPPREDMEATVYDGGEPAITAATAVELGGERRGRSAAAGLTAFATWIERESIFDHVSGTSALRGGSRRLGVEAFVELTPRRWLTVRADATAVDARFVASGNPVPGAPRLLAGGELRLDRAPWSAGVAARLLGARPLSHGAVAAGSAVVDAVGGWTRGRLTLQLELDNLTGSEWNEGEYHYASHWDLSTPASNVPRVHISPGRPFGVRAGAAVRF